MKVEETLVTTAVDYNSDRPSVNIPEVSLFALSVHDRGTFWVNICTWSQDQLLLALLHQFTRS